MEMSRVLQRAVVLAALSTGVSVASGVVSDGAQAQLSGAGSNFLNSPLSNDSVRQRARPEYDPTGIRVGSFLAFPQVDTSASYDSNVFDATNPTSDFVFGIAPRVTLLSDWSRNQIVATAGSRSFFFVDNDSENNTNPDASIQGRFDIGRQRDRPGSSAIRVFAGYQRSTEARGEPEALVGTQERVQFDTYSGGIRWDSFINRLRYGVGVQANQVWFQDSIIAATGLPFDNSDRDRLEVSATGEVGYDFAAGYVAFVRGTVNKREFTDGADRTGVDRDSEGFEVVAGAKVELATTLVGEAFAGYLTQVYEGGGLPDVDGVTFGASLEWYPSPLVTGRINASRSVEDTIVVGLNQLPTSGRFDTNLGIGIDYEAARNIILSGDVGVLDSDFEGSGREDRQYGAGVDGRLLINRNARADLSYDFASRESNIPGQGFRKHQIGVNLRLQR